MLPACSHLSALNMFGNAFHDYSFHPLPRDKGDADWPIVPHKMRGLQVASGEVDITKNFFTTKVIKHWNSLPGKWLNHQPWKYLKDV